MPEQVRGAELPDEDIPGYRVYEGCDGGFFVEHSGEFVGADSETVVEIREGADSLLVGQMDIISTGVGACCEEQGFDNTCIVVTANVSTFDLDATMEWFAEEFADEDRCFGIKFELVGNEAPRCEEDDPECLPLPVCAGYEGSIDAECCQAPPFDPDADRIPIATDPVTDQACSHDGECVVGGRRRSVLELDVPALPVARGLQPRRRRVVLRLR